MAKQTQTKKTKFTISEFSTSQKHLRRRNSSCSTARIPRNVQQTYMPQISIHAFYQEKQWGTFPPKMLRTFSADSMKSLFALTNGALGSLTFGDLIVTLDSLLRFYHWLWRDLIWRNVGAFVAALVLFLKSNISAYDCCLGSSLVRSSRYFCQCHQIRGKKCFPKRSRSKTSVKKLISLFCLFFYQSSRVMWQTSKQTFL
jgi:hypothetical protein